MTDGENLARERAVEQAHLDDLYLRLDDLLSLTEQRRDAVRRGPVAGTPGSRGERDALLTAYEGRLAQLRAVEERLCFGRLDLRENDRRYVGRMGLSDEQQTPVLIDWRAPAAEPFYQATAANPGKVVRRRHLTTKARQVTAIEDELLDLDGLPPADSATLAGEGALMAALGEHRTGRMRDIVSTIQAEQDRVIRAPLKGILVVQGGPGTGKTAVALHRAAYLLYTHRDRIARSGVLLVGPNQAFLRYIEQVLPSLGETGVVTATQSELFPGLLADGSEDPRVAALKGDPRMARIIRAAVRGRQRVPAEPITLRVDSQRLQLRPRDVEGARSRARAAGRPHNQAREIFVKDLLTRLAAQLAAALGRDPADEDRGDLIADLRDAPDVRREVNLCWMPLTPQRLVAALWADPARLAQAAPSLSAAERVLLHRQFDAPWTPADVPLLDEAAELLGDDDTAHRLDAARASAERAHELEYAKGVLQMSGASGMLTADALIDRYAASGPDLSVAERAAEDRTWTFGHVVVDEAQELSPMAWRLLARRCPSLSMTVVGDLAQTSALAGASSWGAVLDPLAAGRWTLAELTVNYRTPGRIMQVAQQVLDTAGISTTPPTSAREGEWPPFVAPVATYGGAELAEIVEGEVNQVRPGRVAVLTPRALRDAVVESLDRPLSGIGVDVGHGGDDLGTVTVLGVDEAKGLEFDAVVLVAPARILAESPRGASDLYVAMTRPTQRLVVVHAEPLPLELAGLTRLSGQTAEQVNSQKG